MFFFAATSGNYAGIHEGGKAEVHQNKDCDDALIQRDEPQLLLQQVPLYAAAKKNISEVIHAYQFSFFLQLV